LWRLGRLKGREERTDLEAALAILKPLAAADRLEMIAADALVGVRGHQVSRPSPARL
jgi:hypothetical protein